MLPASWKTSLAGVVPILGAIFQLGSMVTGQAPVDSTQLIVDLGILSSGLGLLFAKDKNVSNASSPVPARPVPPTA